MATEVITRILCDVCNRDGISREGARFVAAINGKAFEFDLCPEHDAPITDAFKLIDEFGRKPSGGKVAAPKTRQPFYTVDDPQTCPACHGVYKNRGSLTAHARTTHGQTLAELLAAESVAPDPVTCADCGRKFSTRQALGPHAAMHKRQAEAAR